MRKISWDEEKAQRLRLDLARGQVGFEDCAVAIKEGRILIDAPNPSPTYPHQRIFVIEVNNYAYVVPYVASDEELFLKTVYPSRKYTALYLRRQFDE